MQVKTWKYISQASENYSNIQEPTNKTWKIFHITNCKYVGKNKTPFNIRLNNHRKDIKDPKAIVADKQFQKMVTDLTNN